MAAVTSRRPVPLRAITRGPGHHFFGYYDKRQFDPSGRWALGLACGFMDRRQEAGDVAGLGLVDLCRDDRWRPLAETRAWNWQFGCLAQWLPGAKDQVVFNDRAGDRFISRIINFRTGREKELPWPVFDVSPDGRTALSLDFGRLSAVRPETGFRGGSSGVPHPAPDGDGIFSVRLSDGRRKLLVSISALAEKAPGGLREGTVHYVTHPLWNADGTRFLFWHRWAGGDRDFSGRSIVYTADADGGGLFRLAGGNSHTAWRGKNQVLAWATAGGRNARYRIFTDRSGADGAAVGEGVLAGNGHFTFSPDGRWLLTDTAPGEDGRRAVLLYHWETGYCAEIGRFFSPPGLDGEIRCDLHPRWHPGGTAVCIDSAHEGRRAMYLLDARDVIRAVDSSPSA